MQNKSKSKSGQNNYHNIFEKIFTNRLARNNALLRGSNHQIMFQFYKNATPTEIIIRECLRESHHNLKPIPIPKLKKQSLVTKN